MKYCGMEAWEAKRLNTLEDENSKLKRLFSCPSASSRCEAELCRGGKETTFLAAMTDMRFSRSSMRFLFFFDVIEYLMFSLNRFFSSSKAQFGACT